MEQWDRSSLLQARHFCVGNADCTTLHCPVLMGFFDICWNLLSLRYLKDNTKKNYGPESCFMKHNPKHVLSWMYLKSFSLRQSQHCHFQFNIFLDCGGFQTSAGMGLIWRAGSHSQSFWISRFGEWPRICTPNNLLVAANAADLEIVLGEPLIYELLLFLFIEELPYSTKGQILYKMNESIAHLKNKGLTMLA